MKYWFTSDEHYGHISIIKFCNRPFTNTDDMREKLITNFNSRVKPGDITFHLGDMFWRKLQVQDCFDILNRLNGKHYYINGNHEEVFKRPDSFILSGCFESIQNVSMLKHEKKMIWMSHYSHRCWPKSHQGSYHVFGHTHGVMGDYRRSHDVGVDANNYAPVSFDELVTLMESKGKLPPDEIEQDMINHPWPKEFDASVEKNYELLKGLNDASI